MTAASETEPSPDHDVVAIVLCGPGEARWGIDTAWSARPIAATTIVAVLDGDPTVPGDAGEPGGSVPASVGTALAGPWPPGCRMVRGDWQTDAGTAALLSAAQGSLACVLGAGETLEADSWSAAREELAELGPDGLALRIGDRAECRVAALDAYFAERIGDAATLAAHVWARPGPAQAVTRETPDSSAATSADGPSPDGVGTDRADRQPVADRPGRQPGVDRADQAAAAGRPVVRRIPTGEARTPAPPPRGSLAPAARMLAGLPPHLRSAEALADAVCGSDAAANERLAEVIERSELRRLLAVARGDADRCWTEAHDDLEPLVTIRIPTYNRGPLIAERALSSAAAQTYERLEILVVGDCCDDATERAVRRFGDPRVRFVNLAARGMYPSEPALRWLVAGTAPVNAAMDLARGHWIAPCDDDDELTPDHVETLLGAARANGLELVWSKARMEVEADRWAIVGNGHFAEGFISHGTVLFSAGLRFFRYRSTCWKLGEPGDWNLWKRMADAGVHMGFVDAVTYVHYLESPKREEADR